MVLAREGFSVHGWVSCVFRPLLGLGRFLSIHVRTQRHTGRTLEPRLGS
jgi:hypothetical protein